MLLSFGVQHIQDFEIAKLALVNLYIRTSGKQSFLIGRFYHKLKLFVMSELLD
jgi:hypothetical protein